MNKFNVHIYPSIFANETRILKIVRSLRRESVFQNIIVIALWKVGLPRQEVLEDGIELMRVSPVFGGNLPGRLGRGIKAIGWCLGVLLALKGRQVVCINCHSLPVLPLSVVIKLWMRCVLIYEPHELETETAGLSRVHKPVARILERTLIRFADAVCVVNRSIAEWYKAAYSLRTIHVVRNVPYRSQLVPVRTGLLRQALRLKSDSLVFLYQGLLAPGRGVDLLIEAFARLSIDRHLVFMGYGQSTDSIQKASAQYSNIHYMPAVHPDMLQAYTGDADVGLSIIEDVCLSYRLCLPNKIFEYAACGVPALVSDLPEMGGFIEKYDCGWKVEPKIDAMVYLLSSLNSEQIALKQTKAWLVREACSWQDEEVALLSMYCDLGFICALKNLENVKH